jgi:hypothetical protein
LTGPGEARSRAPTMRRTVLPLGLACGLAAAAEVEIVRVSCAISTWSSGRLPQPGSSRARN